MSRPGSLLPRTRRLAGRLLRQARVLRPRVAYLVTGGDDADLDGTLHALRALPGADVAVLVAVAPGSPATAVAEGHVQSDWRLRTVQAPGFRDAARSVAFLGARHVVVLRSGDLPDAAAIDAALTTLSSGRAGPAFGDGLLLADPGSAVFDRATWRALQGAPSATVALAGALARHPGAVRLSAPPVRSGSPSTVRGMQDTRPVLAAWLAAQTEALTELGPDVRGAWSTSVLAGEAQRFLEDAERLDDQQWTALRGLVGELVALCGPAGLEEIPVEGRVRVALAVADRRADLVRFVADRRFEAGQFGTTIAGGVVRALLPVPGDLPAETLVLADSETGLHAELRRLRWVGDEVDLELFACLGGVDLRDQRPDVALALVHEGGSRLDLAVALSADHEVTRWRASHHVNHDLGVLRARLPASDLAPGRWALEATISVQGLSRTGVVAGHDPGGSAAVFPARTVGGREVRAERDPFGLVVSAGSTTAGGATTGRGSATGAGGARIDDVRVVDGRLVVHGQGVDRLRLRGPDGVSTGSTSEDGSPTRGRAVWPLSHDPWGFGPRPLPAGRYLLDGADALAEAFTDRLPEVLLTDDHRVVVRLERRGDAHAVAVVLGPPLADDEVGPYCQKRLQEWYADAHHQLDPTAVYLQSYTGQNATDSPLAVAEELARSRPELITTWAVADRGSRVPTGSATVLWRSRAWYAALARSRYVVTNIELESWFRRRPGQEVLQTFHGYPSKAMGIGLWRSKNFTPTRVEQQLDRTSRNWTLLLTPIPEMDVHYRENYRYDGAILAGGYPRDDVLVSEKAPQVRAAARARLGLADDVVAVLYAPTWRDDQAESFRSARMVDHLDVEAAAEALGPGHVLLLRGHRFMPSSGRTGGSRVVDVTTYPEVNDLILAADVAVLDYSSMRFDFALTGRPMVFLVPDLESYATAKRGFLFDFRPTAPGPLARSSAEVVEALRDLDGLRARHRADYERFNATYNRLQDGRAAGRVVQRFFV